MKYIAKTHVTLNVNNGNGNVHVTFTPQTGGGSVFYTDDPMLASALESHYKYGRLFKKVEEPKVIEAPKKKEVVSPVEDVPQENKVVTKKFGSYEDAKDYLIEAFEFSRTKLRSKADIQRAFKAKNIELIIDD